MIGWLLLLLALPCAAVDLFLTPASFAVSPGERITVTMEGGQWATSQIKDPILIAATGVYNLTNLRLVDGAVMLDGVAKSKGSLIAAAHGMKQGQEYFAKAVLTCEAAGETARTIVGHALEILAVTAPPGSAIDIQLLLRGKPGVGVPLEIVSTGGRRLRAGVTGADGKASLKIGVAGVYRVVAAIDTMHASFTFEIR